MVGSQLQSFGTAGRLLQGQLNSGRLSHAYLLVGPDAAANRQLALLFAAALNCARRVSGCACAGCDTRPETLHPDLQVVEPSGASIKLQQIKDLLANAVLTPNQGRYRVFVIDQAERLTREAANALLLTLEEPEPFSLFLLTATSPVLPTIQSRCQLVYLHQSAAARPAAGRERALSLIQRILQTPAAARTGLVAEVEAWEEGIGEFLATLLIVVRDQLIQMVSGDRRLLCDPEAADQLYNCLPTDPVRLTAQCQLLVTGERMFAANVNRRLLCEQVLASL